MCVNLLYVHVTQVAEDDCGSANAANMQEEPYFVDFMREAPEPTGTFLIVSELVSLLLF